MFVVLCIGNATKLFGPFESESDAFKWISFKHISDSHTGAICANNIDAEDHVVLAHVTGTKSFVYTDELE